MKTIWLIGQRVGYFLLVLFLSSFFLAVFLWVSPGSPGKPRELVNWDDAAIDKVFVCVGSSKATCGPLKSMPAGQPPRVDVLVAGQVVSEETQFVKLPGPSFSQWFSVDFWGGLFRGDVGLSRAYDEPALDVVLEASRHTLPIVFGTLLVSVVLALTLTGVLLWLPFPSLRGVIRTFIMVLSITPVFILAYVMQGNGVLNVGVVTPLILVACLAALCIGDSNLGEVLLQFEHEVRALSARDYVHAARLRGASVFKHMLPGLLLPISSIAAAKVAFLLGSVVIVEWLWGVPGLGEISLVAAEKGDALLLVTLTLLITGVVALVALLRDVIEILIDPRLRQSRGDGP
jgi:peptide/nickel transport system permease protein